MIQIKDKDDVYLIASTRFNTETYAANQRYRRKHNIAAIYGSNMLIREKYPLYAITFVVEMNNNTNEIEGIGQIRNHASCQELKRVYTDDSHYEYNAYFYKGPKWISRTTIAKKDPDLLVIFENILFKKKTHMKRQAGITVLTEQLLENWMSEKKRIKEGMRNLVLRILRVFD